MAGLAYPDAARQAWAPWSVWRPDRVAAAPRVAQPVVRQDSVSRGAAEGCRHRRLAWAVRQPAVAPERRARQVAPVREQVLEGAVLEYWDLGTDGACPEKRP